MNLLTLKPYWKVITDAQSRALDGTCYVVRGCAPTANGTGLRVDVAAGDTVEAGIPHSGYAGGNVTCTTAPAAAPPYYRRDIVYRDSAGTLTVTAGTPALLTSTTPVPPALPASATLLAVIFIAPGQTTLVSTDVEDCRQVRVNDVQALNLKVFGAVGDGVSDDSPALTAAIAALPANGGDITAPAGTYLLASTVTFNKRVHLIGTGYSEVPASVAATTFVKKSTLAGDGFLITTNGCILENLVLDGAAGNTGNGITINANRVTLRNVAVFRAGNDGIRIGKDSGANSNFWRLDQVISKSNGRYGIYVHDSAPDANAGTATGVEVGDNVSDGLRVEKCSTNVWTSVLAQTNGTYGIHVVSPAQYQTFVGGNLESNTTKDIRVEAGALANTFVGLAALAANVTDNDVSTVWLGPWALHGIFLGGATGEHPAISVRAEQAIGTHRAIFSATGGREWQMIAAAGGGADTPNAGWRLRDNSGGADWITVDTAGAMTALGTLSVKKQLYPATDALATQTASAIFAGTGVPNNANGSNGDFYFRSDGGAGSCLYQKRAGSWVATGA